MKKRTAAINIRVTPELKATIERVAAEDSRSLASFIEKLLRDFLHDEIEITRRKKEKGHA